VNLAATVAIDVAAWATVSTAAGYVAHRLPARRFEHDGWLTRPRSREAPRGYERALRIKRWKDRLPEAGALFAGGFSKRALRTRDRGTVERFVVETRRAEHVHWWILASGPLFLLWNPWWLGVAMEAYAVTANVPCIAVQRYNRLRLVRLLRAVPVATDRGSPPVPS
jgi:glycosyl-4,4'-diaponeurosporenoate acyltransferase